MSAIAGKGKGKGEGKSGRRQSAGGVLDNPVAEQAIEWMVLFRSGDATPEDYRRFSDWRAADCRHAQAWERMQGTLQRSFASIRQVQARSPGQAEAVERIMLGSATTATTATMATSPSSGRRKLLRRSLGLIAVGAAASVLLNRAWPLADVLADLRTGTGQRRQFTLPDGSTLVLNARSAVDVDFSGGMRRVRLRQGELIATVAADADHPFIVETPHGTARALGTRFLVRHEGQRSLAMVLEHSIRVDTGGAHQTLRRGEAAWYGAEGIAPVPGDASARAAWADGMLVAEDQSLEEVLAALRPYRMGFIRVSPQAARLRVLGVFAIDDTDNVLRSLEQTMPLVIRHYGKLLVTIDLRAPPG